MVNSETTLSISLVHGGFIMTAPTEDGGYKTEVFTSEGKLMKAVRTLVQANTLIAKSKAEATEDKEAE